VCSLLTVASATEPLIFAEAPVLAPYEADAEAVPVIPFALVVSDPLLVVSLETAPDALALAEWLEVSQVNAF
jgi:hypothetical protein